MDRRVFLKSSAALAAASAVPSQAAGTARPNLLFIMCDEWRAQATGYNGDVNARTPTLDKFAAESVSFDNMISTLPLCGPARACMMSGQYPLKNGVIINDVELKPNTQTMGEAFDAAGYETAYIGKWHLHGSPDGHYGRRAAFIPPDKHYGWHYWKAAECDHDYNHSHYYKDADPTKEYWDGYDAIAQSADACTWLKAYDKKRPFALVLSMGPPHFPYGTAPADYKALFANKALKLRPNVPEERRQAAITAQRGYYSHCAALDDCLKRVLATVDEQGLRENTVVVFVSDHGDMLMSQGLEGKLYPWDESVRIPLLIRYPKVIQPARVDQPANLPDLMPTLLGVCGLPIPKGLQGIDFSGVAFGTKKDGLPESAYLSNPVSTFQLRQCGFDSWRGVRTKTHTYVRAIEGPWLLYDNVKDPYQKNNLANKPEAKDVQAKLDAEVTMWQTRLGDDFLPGAEYLERRNLAYYFETKTPIGQYQSPWGDWGPTMGPDGKPLKASA